MENVSTVKSEIEIHNRILFLLQEKANLTNIQFVENEDNPKQEYILANNPTCFFIFIREKGNQEKIENVGYLSQSEENVHGYILDERILKLYPKIEKENERILNLLHLSYNTLSLNESEEELKIRYDLARNVLKTELDKIPDSYLNIKLDSSTGMLVEINNQYEMILTPYSLQYFVKSDKVYNTKTANLYQCINDKISIVELPLNKIKQTLTNNLPKVIAFMLHVTGTPIKLLPNLMYEEKFLNRIKVINAFIYHIKKLELNTNFMSTHFNVFEKESNYIVASHLIREENINIKSISVSYFPLEESNNYSVKLLAGNSVKEKRFDDLNLTLQYLQEVFNSLDQF